MMNGRLLALDCATSTGFAVFDIATRRLLHSGVADMTSSSQGGVFAHFRNWLQAQVDEDGVDALVYEDAHHRGRGATLICVGLISRVIELADTRRMPRYHHHTTELKKWATGNGTAKKPDMIEAAQKYSGRRITSDDEADAVLLGALCLEKNFTPC